VLVDGSADDDDDEPRAGDELRVVVDLQRPADDLAQGRLGPGLEDGHAAVADLPDGVVVDVVDADVEALLGECDGERQADVAAPPTTRTSYLK
jgi:hypothetical protein